MNLHLRQQGAVPSPNPTYNLPLCVCVCGGGTPDMLYFVERDHFGAGLTLLTPADKNRAAL